MLLENTEPEILFSDVVTDQSNVEINEITIYNNSYLRIVLYDHALCIESYEPISLSRLHQRLDINRSSFDYTKSPRWVRNHSVRREDAYENTTPIIKYQNFYRDGIIMHELGEQYESSTNDYYAIHHAMMRENKRHLKQLKKLVTDEERQSELEKHERENELIEKWYIIGLSDIERRMDEDIEQLQSRPLILRPYWYITCQISIPLLINICNNALIYIDNRSFKQRQIKHNFNDIYHNIEPYEKCILPESSVIKYNGIIAIND